MIFNCGEFNDLEKELIKVLDKKKIKYYSCIKELNIDNNKLYFLQTGEYDNENDNSNAIYTKLDEYKFLFMGDAGIEKEKDILDKYSISNIDVLKIGHHGSKTSCSEEFIDEINPKYSIISVGKNNRYGLYLVIEEALDGTKVRGCTKVIGNNPAIYMTCYLKEKSSFYFALYHEIGHVKSDYNKAKSKIIIDGDDNLEKRADLFAINKMIDQKTYKLILNNLKNKDKICKEKNIPLCFLYSRLAHDGIIKYSDKDYIKNREKISYDN